MSGTSSAHLLPLWKHTRMTLLAFMAVEQKGRLIRGGGKNPTFCWTLCSCSCDCPIAFPYRKGEEGENAGLCCFQDDPVLFLCGRNGEGKAACWTLCSVSGIYFFAPFFSPITSSPSVDWPLLYISIMKRSWGLESKAGKGCTVFDRLLNSGDFAPEVGGYKGTALALGFASECRGGLSMAPVTGRNATGPCACKRGWFHMLLGDRA